MSKILKNTLFQLSKPILQKSSKFYNIHKGESCYIFGDGISIKFFDLKNFTDKIGIACNYIPFHNDFNYLNAQYCVNSAPYFFSPYFGYKDTVFKKYLFETSKIYKEIVTKNPQKTFFFNLSNYPFISGNNVHFNFKKYIADNLPNNFISNRISCFDGVLRNSVSLAIYLGFENIYLIGCDYTFSPSQHYHWYESGEGLIKSIDNYQTDFFNIAAEFADITTITLNGKSDLLSYISYESFTGKKLEYKENINIISDRYLQTLKKWPGFKIL